jgi:hypothetical protein
MLPKNWNDITLEQYVAVYKTLQEEPTESEAILNLLIKRVCLLTNKEPEWVEDNCTMNDLAKMQEFLKAPLPTKLITRFKFNGKRYKVDLDPTKYDAGRYMSVMNQLKDNKIENLHKVIFQICRQVDWKGKTIDVDLNTIQETIEGFKQIPLKVINPISVFFCSLSENLTQSILEYSTQEMTKATELLQTEIDYLKDSDG